MQGGGLATANIDDGGLGTANMDGCNIYSNIAVQVRARILNFPELASIAPMEADVVLTAGRVVVSSSTLEVKQR